MKASRTIDHWRRALADGREAAFQRRGRYFEDYFAAAFESLAPTGPGPFWLVYRMGFKEGYAAGCLERDAPRYLPKKKLKSREP